MCCSKKRARKMAKQAAIMNAMDSMRKQEEARHYPEITEAVAPQPELSIGATTSQPPTYEEVMDDTTPYRAHEDTSRKTEKLGDSKLETPPQRSVAPVSFGHEAYHSHKHSTYYVATPHVPWYAYKNKPISMACRAYHRSKCESEVCWCHVDVSRLRI